MAASVSSGDVHGDASAVGEHEAELALGDFGEVGAHADIEGARRGVVGVRHQDAELLAAVAADQVARADGRLQRAGDEGERAVAGVVPLGVVDELEVIEVDHQDRDRMAVADAHRHLGRRQAHPGAPVEHAGEAVDGREALELARRLVAVRQQHTIGEHGRRVGDDRERVVDRVRRRNVG